MSPFILKSEPKTQNFGFQLLMDCLFSSTLRNSSITFSFSLILKLFYSVANVSDGLGGLKYLYKVMINNILSISLMFNNCMCELLCHVHVFLFYLSICSLLIIAYKKLFIFYAKGNHDGE